jgi:hypothetical protein
MSKPLITSMEEGTTPPPTFEEAMQNEALKKGTAYPQQETWPSVGRNAAAGLPGASNLLVSEQSFLLTLDNMLHEGCVLQLEVVYSIGARRFSKAHFKHPVTYSIHKI